MNHFHFAIASIVDANTGNGLIHADNRASSMNTDAYVHRASRIRAESVIDSFRKAGQVIQSLVENYKLKAREKKAVKSVLQLNEHMLKDIGLLPGDLYGLEHGFSTLDELEAQRKTSSTGFSKPESIKPDSNKLIRPALLTTRINDDIKSRTSANQPDFELPRCG